MARLGEGVAVMVTADRRRQARLVAVAASMLVATACQADEQGLVADRIRSSGSVLIDEVIYRSANLLDPSEVIVYLRRGTTQDEASAFWCEVVVPAGGSNDAGAPVTLWDETGSTMLTTDVECDR
jgi:hypothetical protein